MLSEMLRIARFALGRRTLDCRPGRIVVQVGQWRGLRRFALFSGALLVLMAVTGLAFEPPVDLEGQIDAALMLLTAAAALAVGFVVPAPITIVATPIAIDVETLTLTGMQRWAEVTTTYRGLSLRHSVARTSRRFLDTGSSQFRRSPGTTESKDWWWIEAVHSQPEHSVILYMQRGGAAPDELCHTIATTLRLTILDPRDGG